MHCLLLNVCWAIGVQTISVCAHLDALGPFGTIPTILNHAIEEASASAGLHIQSTLLECAHVLP